MSNEKISVGACLHNAKQLNALLDYLKQHNYEYDLEEMREDETENGLWRGRMIDILVDTKSEALALKEFASSIKVIALTEKEEIRADSIMLRKELINTGKLKKMKWISGAEADKITEQMISGAYFKNHI